MKTTFVKIWNLARPYLNTRNNDIHTRISLKYAQELLKKEGGDEEIVIPAIILHDIGWMKMPEEIQKKAWGPTFSQKLNRIHEIEGVKLARTILKKVGYDKKQAQEILKIIKGHDSNKKAISLNDSLVKDADTLYKFSKGGFTFFEKMFKEPSSVRLKNISKYQKFLFTKTAKRTARQELLQRKKEASS
jgi:HD superfamily phosphodiesterase